MTLVKTKSINPEVKIDLKTVYRNPKVKNTNLITKS